MEKSKISTQAWVWRSMVKTGIIPLILVESVLIAVYLMSNHFISTDNMAYIYHQVNEELKISSRRETDIIREKLKAVENLTALYRSETERALAQRLPVDNFESLPDEFPERLRGPLQNLLSEPSEFSQELLQALPQDLLSEFSNLALSRDGVLYSQQDLGGAASFYSAKTVDKDWGKIAKLARLDPMMKQLKESNEQIASVYFNSWDSYNRIYPWFNTVAQYPSDMDIPEYNFYYLADEQHNPERGIVWTDVYIDPAGHGWMASSIAPVYRTAQNGDQGFLEGVVGLDITVSSIVDSIQELAVPWDGYAVLASNTGMIMALPPQGEVDFGVKELTDYNYQQAISKEVFKPESFNLYKREDTAELNQHLQQREEGITQITLNGASKLISWSTIPETQWRLLLIVDENKMYSKSRSLEEKYQHIGYVLIVGLISFYSLFLIFIWRSSKKMSESIAAPLSQIQNMVDRVSTGDFNVSHEGFRLKEINETANAIIHMGSKLDTLTAALKEAKLEAENANMAKSQFISTVSHELRTPLNSILGMSYILLHSELNNEQKSSLMKIDKSGRHLLSLISDILDLSKFDAGKVEIEHISFDLPSLVHDVQDIFEYKAKKRGVIVHTELDRSIPPLLGDPLRIKQVLLNYVSNAIKFTNNGDIVIRVEVEVLSVESVRVHFSVQDTGIGMSDAEQSKIFDSYQQADSSTTRKYGGTGLGLAISKHIAELMGGTVGVESQCGLGSTFWFTIDLAIDRTGSVADCRSHELPEINIKPVKPVQLRCDSTAIAVFEQKIQYLTLLLEEYDLESEYYYSQHQQCFDKLNLELSHKLSDAVATYDFEKALAIIAQFGIVLEEYKAAQALSSEHKGMTS